MQHLVKVYGKALMAILVVTSCIGILVSGVFIGTSGLNATGARGLAGAAAEIKEEDVTENRVGPELTGIAEVPENFQIQCQTNVMVDESMALDRLFVATEGVDKTYPVSITGIKDASGRDAIANGAAELLSDEVMLHTPGIYRFYIRVVPLQVTKCFEVFCEEKE